MRIALDVMGADAPPVEMVRGGVQAAEANHDVEVVLVGDSVEVKRALDEMSPSSEARLSVHHAGEVIRMDESPGKSVRRKPDSSLCQAVDLAARREADAVVSPGNTGAVVAAALLNDKMGLLAGVRRPGIAVTTRQAVTRWPSTLIDCGATLDCKPINLCQFAVMAAIYQTQVFGTAKPTVGVLSVGEEATKGSPLVKEVSAMLQAANPNCLEFIGNVEGGDPFRYSCNVIACDGFVGNAILKAGEAVGEAFMGALKASARKSWRVRLGLWLAYPHLKTMRKVFDFAEYGAAPLLGVDGMVFICHGRSDSRAIRNAVGVAAASVRSDVNGHIVAALAQNHFAPLGSTVGNRE